MDEPAAPFSDEQTRVFQFFDGRKQICGDPIRLYRRLNHSCGGDVNRVIADTQAGVQPDGIEDAENEPLRFAATEKLVEAIRQSFPMAPFNPDTGEGATDDDCINALNAYVEWTQKKSRPGEPPSA